MNKARIAFSDSAHKLQVLKWFFQIYETQISRPSTPYTCAFSMNNGSLNVIVGGGHDTPAEYLCAVREEIQNIYSWQVTMKGICGTEQPIVKAGTIDVFVGAVVARIRQILVQTTPVLPFCIYRLKRSLASFITWYSCWYLSVWNDFARLGNRVQFYHVVLEPFISDWLKPNIFISIFYILFLIFYDDISSYW